MIKTQDDLRLKKNVLDLRSRNNRKLDEIVQWTNCSQKDPIQLEVEEEEQNND